MAKRNMKIFYEQFHGRKKMENLSVVARKKVLNKGLNAKMP